MDAKPQRLARPLPAVTTKTFGDENVAVPKQSLHQKHKSVGNLNSNMQINSTNYGLNGAPKRTVFGDVSNTAHAQVDKAPKNKDMTKPRTFLETNQLDKIAVPAKVKQTVKETGASGAAFLRPAQRAMGPLPGHQISAAPKPLAHLDAPLVKPTVTKKATFVFSDDQNSAIPKAPIHASVASTSTASGVETRLKNPRHFKSQPQLRSGFQMNPAVSRMADQHPNSAGELITLDRAEIRRDVYQPQPPSIQDVPPPVQRHELDHNSQQYLHIDDGASDVLYEDALENLGSLSSSIETKIDIQQEPEDTRDVEYSRHEVSQYEHEHEHGQGNLPQAHSHSRNDALANSVSTEPEENWDGEDDDGDYYEEQGYTTAHSYRSHGDNTTGGVTTIVAPKVTAKVRNELELARIYVEQHTNEDQVEEESWDTSMVAEYGEEIFAYMRSIETKPTLTPNPHYMDIQSDIMWSMRSILMDWLVQVHARFNLLPETLFLTVNCIDRFLSVKVVSLSKLQLVGATAIFVAAKYEEINCPSVQEIVYMVDGGFTIDEVLKAERFMLSMLEFELGWPGPMSFLRRISKADDYCIETRTLAKYFLEVTIMDERFVGSPPSFLAAGAHCLARLMLKKGDWSPAHTHWSGYTISQLKPLVSLIFECCLDSPKHHWAVYDKYKASRYRNASMFVENEIGKGYVLDFHPFDAYSSSPPTRAPLDDFSVSMVQYALDESRRLIPTQG